MGTFAPCHAPKKSQTSVIPTLGSSSARPHSGCPEGELQHCTGASPLPRVRVLVLAPQVEALCCSPAKLPTESWCGAGASARAEQELVWLQGEGGGGEGGLPVHVCMHMCACPREHSSRAEGLQHRQMYGWTDRAGLAASCPPPPPLLSALRSLIQINDAITGN